MTVIIQIMVIKMKITSGVLIRFVVTSGILTEPFKRDVTQTNAPLGTIVAIVGTRASCHPIPFIINNYEELLEY